MLRRSVISLAMLAALAGTTRAQTVAIPDTPVGRLLRQWLTAFNAADSSALATFYAAHLPSVKAQGTMQLARNSGGLEVVRIITADASHILFAARPKNGGNGVRGRIDLADGSASQIRNFGIQAVPPGAPLEGCTSYSAPSTHGTSAEDVASEDAIVAALYSAISGPPCQHRDWERFRGLFVPGGRLIPKVAGPNGTFTARVETSEEYSASVMGSMEEFGFFEKEIAHVGESFNGVAHRFSTYESRRAANDPAPYARGISSIQLLFDGKRWWVVTVYWASERPDAPIPASYLGRPPM